jgi:NADPH-dependent 2,4-dienoyl-CoA reductase/sulfur reductase-like enzyme/Fe-S-cluster-containing hydrogenase component 2/CRP-like cAMP-binding protein
MNTQMSYLIVGNGIAGVSAAEILRSEDPTSSITIISDDPFPVYYRPALKDYLARRVEQDKLWARPSTLYQQQRIRFIPGRVAYINASQHYVQLNNGQRGTYHKLLLANGARPRQLDCPGTDLAGVTTLRTVADYQQIIQNLNEASSIVVCGSGTLSLETAESLCHQGYQVTHLLRHSTLWSEILDTTASDLVLHEEQRVGIDVRKEEEIAEIVGKNGRVSEVVTTRGARIPCDMVLIAIGIEPLTDFARVSGIDCGRGIKVDSKMRTNQPDIYAAGDVIETTDPITGKTRVVGQWYPAIQQAQAAAYNMLEMDDIHHPFDTGAFYNATFLCGLEFVSVGLTTFSSHIPALREIVAEPQPRTYRKVLLHQGIPVGALFLGDRKHALAFKRAIDYRVNLDAVSAQLFSEHFQLDTWLDEQGIPKAIVGVQESGATGSSIAATQTARTEEQKDGASLHMIQHPKVQLALEKVYLPSSNQGVVLSIGRSKQATIHIDHRSVSRLHAEIACFNGDYYLRDLNSSNGTFVNNSRVAPKSVHTLRQHDKLRFGDIQLRFQRADVAEDMDFAAHAIVVGQQHRTDRRTLTKKQVHFEIDMCIGCDRCMSACPVPLSSQVSIAALNQATASADVAPIVERFTHECILCGSCVPVCPVDNHRDLLMVSLKQRLGASWEGKVDEQHLRTLLPANWTVPLLISQLRRQRILSDANLVTDNYLLHMVAASQFLTLTDGSSVLREGEYGRDLYLVLQGSMVLSASDATNQDLPLAIINQGEFIGEYGMLTGQSHALSARAQGPALLLQIPEQVMQRLMELVPGIHAFFDQMNNAHSLKSILKRLALFQGVSDEGLDYLIQQAQVKQYERGAPLFTEERSGRPARETLHILLEGFVKVARQNVTQSGEYVIAYRQGGDYFAGGLDLLGDSRAVTVSAINRTRVAEVPSQALLMLFHQYPEIEQRFKVRLHEYIASTASMQAELLPQNTVKLYEPIMPLPDDSLKVGLQTLVNHGVVEGTEVLIIDLDKCIHCNECEEACTRRHGRSRMNRNGRIIGNISIATACRQCQDPVCMLCSRAGIARHPNGEVYITDSCIGCGICAERCPYGAISIVDVDGELMLASARSEKKRKRASLPMLQGNAVQRGDHRVAPGPLDLIRPHDAYEEMRKKIAIKCDLCAGYNDQACVESCPTGAALRVQPTTFFGTTEEILQR